MARPSDRGERNEALRLLVAAISGILLLVIIGGAGLYYLGGLGDGGFRPRGMHCWFFDAERKGYSERAGLAAGLLLSAIGVVVWLVWPARAESRWKQEGPLPRRHR